MTTKAQTVYALGDQDYEGYKTVVSRLVKEGSLRADAQLTYLVQYMEPVSDNYIGTILRIDGPLETRSSGPEPIWRKWVVADADWNIRLFDYKIDADRHICGGRAQLRAHPYRLVGKNFLNEISFTLDISRFAVKV